MRSPSPDGEARPIGFPHSGALRNEGLLVNQGFLVVSRIQQYCMFVGVCGVMAFAGCGQSNEPKFVPVAGAVTIDGTPVHGARIEFLPDTGKGTDGPASFAELDENGDYVL